MVAAEEVQLEYAGQAVVFPVVGVGARGHASTSPTNRDTVKPMEGQRRSPKGAPLFVLGALVVDSGRTAHSLGSTEPGGLLWHEQLNRGAQ